MNDNEIAPRRMGRTAAVGVGLAAAGLLAGGVLAGTLSASADTTPSTGTSSSQSAQGSTADQSGTQNGRQGGTVDPGGAAPVRSDEKALSGSDAEKATTAALAAVPGGTVIRAETDAGDATYEVHMRKADGTLVTVKLDDAFAVTAVEDGMGLGDPAPNGQNPNGQNPNGQNPNGQNPNGQNPNGQNPNGQPSASATG
jgi:hypothetical protein